MTNRLELAGLTARVVGPDDALTTVVLMHGFGAPGEDLVSLADSRYGLNAPRTRYVFPAAPLELGAMYGSGRAWWLIDMMKIQEAMRSGRPRDVTEIPPGLHEARTQVVQFLVELQEKYAIPNERLVLGGFSQGSMIAIDVALARGIPVGGLILMSSTIIAEPEWQPKLHQLAGTPIIQSHGKQDMILPFVVAESLRERLVTAGAKHEWHPFTGGHEIPPQVLGAISQFLTARATA